MSFKTNRKTKNRYMTHIGRSLAEGKKRFIIMTFDDGEVEVYAWDLEQAIEIADRDYPQAYLEVYPEPIMTRRKIRAALENVSQDSQDDI